MRECGGDRPTLRPPSNLTVTAVSELKIGKISSARRPNTHEPRRGHHHSFMSLEPPTMRKLLADPAWACAIRYAGRLGPNRLGRFFLHRSQAPAERLTGPQTENLTPGGQFHKAVIRLVDRYTQCAKCGCDRPTSDPPECVKQAGDRSTDRSQCVTRVATR